MPVMEMEGLKTSDYYFDLPKELIAQDPLEDRSASRLLVMDRQTGATSHHIFKEICSFLKPGDCLVLNNTKVIPARLLGAKEDTGAAVEILLLKRMENDVWETLVKPGKKLRPGAKVVFGDGRLRAEILDVEEDGNRLVKFFYDGIWEEVLDSLGEMPLPPYITDYEGDPEKYQTVYAMPEEHSAAAPTAGLHFTPELMQRIEDKGAHFAAVELEVGIDTFRLVEEDDPTQHVMHTERYHVPAEVVDAVHATKAAGHRVIAVGTTAVRSLESAFDADAPVAPKPVTARYFENRADGADTLGRGDITVHENATTQLYLMPGSTYHVVDALITNFHVPRSTLMMLVSALASRDQVMDAYEQAIKARYRFFSFGDAMLIE